MGWVTSSVPFSLIMVKLCCCKLFKLFPMSKVRHLNIHMRVNYIFSCLRKMKNGGSRIFYPYRENVVSEEAE